MAGIEPAQPKAPDLQSGPPLQLWRIPIYRELFTSNDVIESNYLTKKLPIFNINHENKLLYVLFL